MSLSYVAPRDSTIALMLESEGPGGAEVVVLHLAEELRRRGHTVCPVILTRANTPGWLEQQYSARGFSPERLGIRGALDWKCLRELIGILRRRGVTAVHSHEFGMAIYGTAAARWLELPHVITMHGNMWMTDAWRRRAALRWAFRRSVATAVSNDTTRHLLEKLDLPAQLITTVWNGIPDAPGDRGKLRKELGLADTTVLVTAVGNLIERKGHAFLVRALAALEDEGDGHDWHLAIAGEGVERPVLERLIENADLASRVSLLGHRGDVADVLAGSDVFVMPSIWEGLPLAVLEAMFARNAVIASGISGIPEALPTEDVGLLVPPSDVPALTTALRRVIADPDLRLRMGEAARARALKHFVVGQMAGTYERMLERAAP